MSEPSLNQMSERKMAEKLRDLAATTKYPVDAFIFVQRGLDHTVRGIHGEGNEEATEVSRHVTGEQLCIGLRDLAIDEYGLMARAVLKRWNILTCEDFGNIVFAMVDANMMQKTDDDTIVDFQEVFDFSEAFSPSLLNENRIVE